MQSEWAMEEGFPRGPIRRCAARMAQLRRLQQRFLQFPHLSLVARGTCGLCVNEEQPQGPVHGCQMLSLVTNKMNNFIYIFMLIWKYF